MALLLPTSATFGAECAQVGRVEPAEQQRYELVHTRHKQLWASWVALCELQAAAVCCQREWRSNLSVQQGGSCCFSHIRSQLSYTAFHSTFTRHHPADILGVGAAVAACCRPAWNVAPLFCQPAELLVAQC
jgi:hypothetical protein